MAVNTGLGGSRSAKESTKGFYWHPEMLQAASGIQINIGPELVGSSSFKADVDKVPWGSRPEFAIQIGTTGYTGEVTISGSTDVTLTFYNGVVTNVSY